ncbi:MAG: dTDP-4-dehydrorhamnose reductase [Thermodesulfatator sp.]|nr:MAG: dTDP-4-dehydrorhamnose reductase [Thermodesulfatator sp.]
MKILLVGAYGQLGREFIRALEGGPAKLLAFGKEELDVSNLEAVYRTLKEIRPQVVINCAAYNQVDEAESEAWTAYKVNALGPYHLALVCREIKAKLVHYSTDYIFDGTKRGLYLEDDPPNPLNTYGKSKLFGEVLVREVLESSLVFRVSWVYGEGQRNFLYRLEQWARSQECLKVTVDEFSVPTSTRTIVEVSLKALEEGLEGLWHLVNSGYASRYEWAKEYFRLKGVRKLIYPACQAEFALPAPRPRWSVMSNERICALLGKEIPLWNEELKSYLQRTGPRT